MPRDARAQRGRRHASNALKCCDTIRLTPRGPSRRFRRELAMRRALPAILVLGSLAIASTAFTPPNYAILGQAKGPAQPIKFSHKVHTNKLGMDCLYCHYGAIK